jgi:phospholipase C
LQALSVPANRRTAHARRRGIVVLMQENRRRPLLGTLNGVRGLPTASDAGADSPGIIGKVWYQPNQTRTGTPAAIARSA